MRKVAKRKISAIWAAWWFAAIFEIWNLWERVNDHLGLHGSGCTDIDMGGVMELYSCLDKFDHLSVKMWHKNKSGNWTVLSFLAVAWVPGHTSSATENRCRDFLHRSKVVSFHCRPHICNPNKKKTVCCFSLKCCRFWSSFRHWLCYCWNNLDLDKTSHKIWTHIQNSNLKVYSKLQLRIQGVVIISTKVTLMV